MFVVTMLEDVLELVGIDVDLDGSDDDWANDITPAPIDVDLLDDPFGPDTNPLPPVDGELPNFDAPEDAPGVVGEPWDRMDNWHLQETDHSCAVAAQEFILDELSGEDFSEADVYDFAEAQGWVTEGGTAPDDVGKVLEAAGIGVERSTGHSMDDLEAQLAAGEHVIVAVDSSEIWTPGITEGQDSWGDPPGFPGQGADHAVEVIGIDRSDPANPMVILNDSGHPEGRGSMIPLDEFEDAWADSDHYMMTTVGTAA